ncbi:MAG: response regulator [Lachnospira sp.]
MEIAKKILEKKQMKVTCAYNGAEAVALFEKMPEYTFDAVIMDIRMPVTSRTGSGGETPGNPCRCKSRC